MIPLWSLRRAVAIQSAVDVSPPTFAGATGVVGVDDSSILVTWDEAADGNTSADDIVYSVYLATEQGGQDFNTAAATVTGDTSATIPGLSEGVSYYAVVRARDAAGNQDANDVEVGGQTFGSGRKTRNRRRSREGGAGTMSASARSVASQPFRLTTKKE